MPDDAPSQSDECARALGRRLACEGILRTEFGTHASSGLSRALEQIKKEEKVHPVQFRPYLALVAAFTLLLGLGLWYYPRMGPPVLAQVTGAATVERAGESLPASEGIALRPGDLLHTTRTGTVAIAFAPEDTSFVMSPSTDLRFVRLSHGKRFDLNKGRIDATVARQRPFHPLIVNTRQAEVRVLGTKLTILATNGRTQLDVAEGKVRFTRLADESHVNVRGGQYAVAADSSQKLAALPRPGAILLEWWTNVSWSTPSDALADPRFPSKPDGSKLVETFELAPMVTNHFAVRFRGYLHPPETGEYEFWDASSGTEQLFLSPSEKASEKVIIASGGSGIPRDWDSPQRFQKPHSQPLLLERGKLYYIEGFAVIEKAGSFHFSVAWKRPGQSRELLDARFISAAKGKQ